MALFSENKIYEDEDTEAMRLSERAEAIESLEERRAEINRELEGIMKAYARLTKSPRLSKHWYSKESRNKWQKPKI